MNWQLFGYATACVLVPVLWGVAVVWVSNRIERRISGKREKSQGSGKRRTVPPIEYHI